MEKLEKFQRMSQEKGITLVALVITIIILIILATVAINFAFGNNGLIQRAEDARDYYANDTSYTDESITNVESYLDEIINGVGSGNGNGGSGSGNTTEDGVPIPDGFYYVGGTKEEGVVISDDPADEGKGTSHEVAQTLEGNQFVWIPVEDDSLFQRYEGYYEGSLQSTLSGCSEPFANGYSTEAEEYEAMRTSVLENNGFYVGRYEAGTTATRSSSSGITDPVVIKQGVNVYNWIGWNGNEDNAINDETGGAVELSKNFADANGYTSVTSTLIYGVQWDAIMNFIDPAYATGSCDTSSSFVANSTDKGNYSGGLATTGSNANYAVKNIYDLGGNVREWTMEAYSTNYRVNRGRRLQLFWLRVSSFWS